MENENVENVVMTVEEAIAFLNENGYGVLSDELAQTYLADAMSAISNYSLQMGYKLGAILMGACVLEYTILEIVPWKKIGKALFGKKKPKNEETKADTTANAETK